MSSSAPPLVTADWLADHLTAPDLRIIDGSWYLPQMNRDAEREYAEGHIPGALFVDLDGISDSESPFPHMLPSPEKFSSRMKQLGIGDGHHVIVYDGAGLFSAARFWWMFKTMGHDNVSVLDGGLPKWIAAAHPTEAGSNACSTRHHTVRPNQTIRRDITDMRRNLETAREQVVDARSRGRFTGADPEPRPELSSGHMPGSLSLPFGDLLNEDGTLKTPADLIRIFETAGVDLSKPVVTTCGSGVTAAIPFLALTVLGHPKIALYDGSWSEWAATEGTPIEKD
ncbi:MAG: 3-mercaptopyruvate sulfurtransferase [Rhodobiaceae bacterium]|nr:3-mercaptopyruvate sulfurtransferase [Rhodobiaceae bacterium]